MRGIEIALVTWLKEPRTLLSVLHLRPLGLPFSLVFVAMEPHGGVKCSSSEQLESFAELSWDPPAPVCYTTHSGRSGFQHSPWQVGPWPRGACMGQGSEAGSTREKKQGAEPCLSSCWWWLRAGLFPLQGSCHKAAGSVPEGKVVKWFNIQHSQMQ